MNCILQAEKIYELCVVNAKSRKTLTYREVLDFLGYGKRVQAHAIRYGLELTWIACAHAGLPILTSIIIDRRTGAPSATGYIAPSWEEDKKEVFNLTIWPSVEDIDWDYVYKERKELSKIYQTRGYFWK